MARASEIPGLDCEADLSRGIHLVLSVRLEEMCALRDAALDWSSIEGVHDMRVASRRLRSALRDFMPYLRKRKVRPLRDSVEAVADALGGVRDRDVAIQALEKIRDKAPFEVAAGIERLIAEQAQQRGRARGALIKAISEETIATLQARGTEALGKAIRKARAGRAGTRASTAESTFRQGGVAIITTRWREMEELSVSLYRPLASKPLHRLRISAKRLRYAIELLATCWGESLAPFAKEIAGLQSSLGELHDCDVWIESLGALLLRGGRRRKDSSIEAAGIADVALVDERRAAAWLMQHFIEERTMHFREALARWHGWEMEHFAARLFMALEVAAPVQSEGHRAGSAATVTASATAEELSEVS